MILLIYHEGGTQAGDVVQINRHLAPEEMKRIAAGEASAYRMDFIMHTFEMAEISFRMPPGHEEGEGAADLDKAFDFEAAWIPLPKFE